MLHWQAELQKMPVHQSLNRILLTKSQKASEKSVVFFFVFCFFFRLKIQRHLFILKKHFPKHLAKSVCI